MAKKLTKEEKKKLELKFVKYGWQILEAKFCYYQGGKHKITSFLKDAEYDELEAKYIKLAKKLKKKPRATDQVGFPADAKEGAFGMITQHMIATKGRRSRVKEIKKEVSAALKTIKKVLQKELSEKKAKDIYKKVKAELNPNK